MSIWKLQASDGQIAVRNVRLDAGADQRWVL